MILAAGALALAFPYVRAGSAVAWEAAAERLRRTDFDAAAWRDPTRSGPPERVRLRMVDDLLGRVDFTGWSRRDVVGLLGEPELPRFGRYDLAYVLGPERGLGADTELLAFRLDLEGRVVEARLVTD